MTMWEKIIEAQVNKIGRSIFTESGQEAQILVKPNGWYEGFVSFS